MKIIMLKSKIHRAKVSEARLDYVGSISIDEELLEKSGILEYEKVQIVNINNGQRFSTYTIAAPRHSKMICLNGAAARKVSVGDIIIIMAYAKMKEKKAKNFKPKVLFVNENNEIIKLGSYEKYGALFEEERG